MKIQKSRKSAETEAVNSAAKTLKRVIGKITSAELWEPLTIAVVEEEVPYIAIRDKYENTMFAIYPLAKRQKTFSGYSYYVNLWDLETYTRIPATREEPEDCAVRYVLQKAPLFKVIIGLYMTNLENELDGVMEALMYEDMEKEHYEEKEQAHEIAQAIKNN